MTLVAELCEVCGKVPLGTVFKTGSGCALVWNLEAVLSNATCPLCKALRWMFMNTPDCSGLENGVAVGYAYIVQLKPPLYSMSWTFYSADGQTRKLCSHGILPFGSDHPIAKVKDTFDADLVRSWLSRCNKHHDCRTAAQPHSGDFTLRVIDVEDWCITNAPSPCDYVALSYVWGTLGQPVLNSENRSLLQIKGSLRNLDLPQTIEDAIHLCKLLQLRYLWVDSLCIEQDSTSQSDHLVTHMHEIYKQAYITLVVAAGTDCHSGIPSVRERQSLQFCTTIQGFHVGTSLVNLELLERTVLESAWNSRAWTMQEYALSRRCLIFTTRSYFFSCTKGSYVESSPGRQFQPRQAFAPVLFEQRLLALSGHDLILRTYAKAVYAYMQRRMTYSSDVLRAFEGMTSAMAPFIGKCWWGLPHRALRYTLCWSNDGVITSRAGFPSWSWAGWQPRELSNSNLGSYSTSFPSFGISNIWPYCTVYRWDTANSLRPFQHRYKYAIEDWPKKPYKIVEDHANAVVSGDTTALLHWMYEQPLTTDPHHYDFTHDFMFADRIPLFRYIPNIDLKLILTFLSCTAVFASDAFAVEQHAGKPSHTVIMASLEPAKKNYDSALYSRPVYSHSDPESSGSLVTFVLLGHVQFQSKVVVLPINITLSAKGDTHEADEIVARRKGNPKLMDEDTFLGQARKAIVHLW